MAKEKMCPLSFSRSNDEVYYDCQKEKCAWWDDLVGLCAILSIARHSGEGSFYRHRQEQKEAMVKAGGG